MLWDTPRPHPAATTLWEGRSQLHSCSPALREAAQAVTTRIRDGLERD